MPLCAAPARLITRLVLCDATAPAMDKVPPLMEMVPLAALVGAPNELAPPPMVSLVRHCTLFAHQRLSVTGLTRALGVSRRTLNRATHRAGWPSPSDLIWWGRVLRAGAIRMRGHDDAADIARLAGFRSSHALAAALERYLGPGTTLDDLVPTDINRAIRRAISTGGRTDGVAPVADER